MKAAGQEVRSLTPKLKEMTRIKADDAGALLGLFFTQWPFEKNDPKLSEEERVTYAPLASEDEIDAFVYVIVEALRSGHAAPALLENFDS